MSATLFKGANKILPLKKLWDKDSKLYNDEKIYMFNQIKSIEHEFDSYPDNIKKYIQISPTNVDIDDLDTIVCPKESKSQQSLILFTYDASTALCDSKTDECCPLFKLTKTKLHINNNVVKHQEGSRNNKVFGGSALDTLPVVGNQYWHNLGSFMFYDKVPGARIGLLINKPHPYDSIENNAYQQARTENHFNSSKKSSSKVFEYLPSDTLKNRHDYLVASFDRFKLHYMAYNMDNPNKPINKVFIISNPIMDSNTWSAKADHDHLHFLVLKFVKDLVTLKIKETDPLYEGEGKKNITIPKVTIIKITGESYKNRNIYKPSANSLKRARSMVMINLLLFFYFLYFNL